jgi:hypothetical protein
MNNDDNDYAGGGNTYQPPPSKFGNPAYDRVNSFYQAHLGRDGSQQEVSQWGSNIDNNYLNSIGQSIYNSEESRKYRTPATPEAAPEPAKAPPGGNGGGRAASGSPVTANGQIPPPAPVVAPKSAPAYQAAKIDVKAPEAYKAPGAPLPSYQPDKFTQFANPDQSGIDNQSSALMNAILANPQTMNPGVVAQMKEAQKQEALAMQHQRMQGQQQHDVASGTLGSGYAQAAQGGFQNDAINAILQGNRGIDMQAASTNRQNELDALSASNAFQTGQMGRATQGYGATLQGQGAQAQANQFGVSSALQAAIAGEQMKQAQFDSQFRNTGLDFGVQQANAGEQYKAQQSGAQNAAFDAANYFQANQQNENRRQFNNTLGFNYNQLDQSDNQFLMDWLMRNGG